MARITIKEIQEKLASEKWGVVSPKYFNLETEMHFCCAEGHDVYTTWGNLRKKIVCPVCQQSTLMAPNTKIIPKKPGDIRTLALDQASHVTGYSIFDKTKLITTGTFVVTDSNEISRMLKIKNWLLSMINMWKPDVIGLEGIQFQDNDKNKKMGVTTFEVLARLQGILMITCYEQNIHCELCPTNTWRHACGVKGKSRSDKKKSMQLLVKQWYDMTVSDDIADAIGIGHYLCNLTNKCLTIENWESE